MVIGNGKFPLNLANKFLKRRVYFSTDTGEIKEEILRGFIAG